LQWGGAADKWIAGSTHALLAGEHGLPGAGDFPGPAGVVPPAGEQLQVDRQGARPQLPGLQQSQPEHAEAFLQLLLPEAPANALLLLQQWSWVSVEPSSP